MLAGVSHCSCCDSNSALGGVCRQPDAGLTDLQEMEMGELLKFFGVLILITQFEFNSQSDLWKPVSDNKFILCLAIGTTTGMAKHQFENLLANITFSDQTETRPDGMSLEKVQVEIGGWFYIRI
jgi:Transposase IS4